MISNIGGSQGSLRVRAIPNFRPNRSEIPIMFDDLTDHGSNSYKDFIEAISLDINHDPPADSEAMSLKELNIQIDCELLEEALSDFLQIPLARRSAAIADFAEADPALAKKLHLELLFQS